MIIMNKLNKKEEEKREIEFIIIWENKLVR